MVIILKYIAAVFLVLVLLAILGWAFVSCIYILTLRDK